MIKHLLHTRILAHWERYKWLVTEAPPWLIAAVWWLTTEPEQRFRHRRLKSFPFPRVGDTVTTFEKVGGEWWVIKEFTPRPWPTLSIRDIVSQNSLRDLATPADLAFIRIVDAKDVPLRVAGPNKYSMLVVQAAMDAADGNDGDHWAVLEDAKPEGMRMSEFIDLVLSNSQFGESYLRKDRFDVNFGPITTPSAEEISDMWPHLCDRQPVKKPRSSDLDHLPQHERKLFCYCKEGQTHCGTCSCGKPGHLRGLMMGTFVYCDDCYAVACKEIND